MIGPTRRRAGLDQEAGHEAPTPTPTARRVPAPVGADPVAVGRRLRSLPPAERATETRRLQRAYGNRWVTQATAPRPLPPEVRARMEGAFDTPLGDVVVGEGPEAESIDAAAFTSGNRIVFHPGVYDPHSAEGLEVLGHELAHVLQQRAGRVPGTGVNEDPALEAEAERAGERVARGEHVDVAAGPDAGSAGPAVVQPMRWPWSRRGPSTPAQAVVASPPDPTSESKQLHQQAYAIGDRIVECGNRGDRQGMLAAQREHDEILYRIEELVYIKSGYSPAEAAKLVIRQPLRQLQPIPEDRPHVPQPQGSESAYDLVQTDRSLMRAQPEPPYFQTPAVGSTVGEPPYFQTPAVGSTVGEPPYLQTPAQPEPPYLQTPAAGPTPVKRKRRNR